MQRLNRRCEEACELLIVLYSDRAIRRRRTLERLEAIYSAKQTVVELKIDHGQHRTHLYTVEESQLDLIFGLISRALFTLPDDADPQTRQSKSRLGEALATLTGVRSVSCLPLATKMTKLAKDTAGALGKELDVEVLQFDQEVDLVWYQILAESLMHLVRNCVDHGIELPAQRVAAGKAAAGKLCLEMSQTSRHILLRISDDGRGLDPEVIAAQALKKGVLDKPTLAQLTSYEKQELIFHPGFSTRDAVSEISGRGVGMDVVRRSIERKGGKIFLDSQPGHGSTFAIRIPLGSYRERCAVVRIGAHKCALGQARVVGVINSDYQVAFGSLELPDGNIFSILALKELDPDLARYADRPYLLIDLDGTTFALGISAHLGDVELRFFQSEDGAGAAPYLHHLSNSEEVGRVWAIDTGFLADHANDFLFDEENFATPAASLTRWRSNELSAMLLSDGFLEQLIAGLPGGNPQILAACAQLLESVASNLAGRSTELTADEVEQVILGASAPTPDLGQRIATCFLRTLGASMAQGE